MRDVGIDRCSVGDAPTRQSASATVAASCRGILETIPVAAYTCDAVGLITYFNPVAASVWGRAPKLRDAADRYCGSYRLHSCDGTAIPHDQCWMALALQSRRAYHACEIVIERQDGTQKVALAHAHPLRNDRGELVGGLNLIAELLKPNGSFVGSPTPRHPSAADTATAAMIGVAVHVLTLLPWDDLSLS